MLRKKTIRRQIVERCVRKKSINRATMRINKRTKMLEFKKYSSIENSFSREFMEHIWAEMPQDLEYVVQEKVHGTNTSFLCDGRDVGFAKRTSMLAEGEQFYDYPELVARYKERVLKLFADIKARCPEVTQISVFGEMFGGLYPHDGVQKERNEIGRASCRERVLIPV